MTSWRMSFRVGTRGYEMWPHCRNLGIAAITYSALSTVDLSKHEQYEPRNRWSELAPSQKASLGRVAYEMTEGDVIYVKQGQHIVGKGIVQGAKGKPAYRFRLHFLRPPVEGEPPWLHQVPVAWQPDFPEIPLLLGAEQLTVKRLAERDVTRIENKIPAAVRSAAKRKKVARQLLEEAYFRASKAALKTIIPRHNKLSNHFCNWLDEEHAIQTTQEQDQVDVSFMFDGKRALAELKVCYAAGTRKSIREALGQILEYNHYPTRSPADALLIILDSSPTENDQQYIDILRKSLSLPISLGWQRNKEFSFHPSWPFE